jgi:hypothetical protein
MATLSVQVTGLADLNLRLRQQIQQTAVQIADDFVVAAKQNTPVRTGVARSGWKSRKEAHGATVENRVPYVQYLDQGTKRMRPANGGKGIIGPALNSIKGKYK